MILKIIYNMSIYKTLNNIQKEKGTQTITKKKSIQYTRREQKKKETENYKSIRNQRNSDMYITIHIALNVKGLNVPIKTHKEAD